VSGNPVRAVSCSVDGHTRVSLGVASSAFLVTVSGGSQGARAINNAVVEWVRAGVAGERTVAEGLTLLWSFGRANEVEVEAALTGVEVPWLIALPYIDDLPAAFEASDLAVGRAGAMSTSEMLNAGLPAILVPLPSAAADHQAVNAHALHKQCAAVVLTEKELSGSRLAGLVEELAGDAPRLAEMSRRARSRARPDAAREIAEDVILHLPFTFTPASR